MIIQPKPAGTHGWVNGGHNRFINRLLFVSSLSSAPLCGAFGLKQCRIHRWAILGSRVCLISPRILLQQPDLAALSETLTGLVQQSALADRAAIILWHSGNHRAVRHACDDAGQPVSYEDETVLANGPVRRLLSRPDALHCDSATFAETWPQLAGSGLYPTFGYYCLLPLAAEGRIFGGCEFIRDDNRPWTEKEYQRLHTFTQIVAVVTEQIQSRVSNNVDYDLLCRERDNFRILVAITNRGTLAAGYR
ncbi:formate hydrogenlyase transcriptional activator FhlA [Klebsiella michiganensis]|uniref:Formate hydrogenlyase transcriptional activator FhlA n=1 Tax=Klebsiella michiganensis TaxID=1134687 RepID=A0A7H4PMJ2_9ENTR|nr:formate hydrogenlyase transcriptional activator FhlA [Klebsiella michiganensis]